MTDKAALRRTAEDHRRALAHPGFAARVAAHAPALAPQAVVSGYIAFREEADPGLLLAALAKRGHPVALPVLVGRGKALAFRRWHPGMALVAHSFGMLEPPETAASLVPDILLVPLLAFDARGHRLGYGGGYYDRTLQALRAEKTIEAIGLAYAGQEVALLPAGAHDERLDAVLTEEGLRRFG